MKDMNMLIWLTQLGLSVALPLAGFVLLGVYLHTSLGWGIWTVPTGLVLGIICAILGFRDSLKSMERMSGAGKQKAPPSESFNQHH